MPRDVFTTGHRCRYCGRPGSVVRDGDLVTCGHEICEALAFAEVRRRRRHARAAGGAPPRATAA